MSTPTHSIMERLLFIRHLYRHALLAAEEKRPLKASAILDCHDAVELLLALLCEVSDRPLSFKTAFAQYFDLLRGGAPPIILPYESTMLRLNTARVGLKHHGLIPDDTTISELVTATGAFLSESVHLRWNLTLDDISLVRLIRNERTRALLLDAEQLLANGKRCTHEFSEAFGHIVKDVLQRLSGDSTWTAVFLGPDRPVFSDDETRKYFYGLHNKVEHVLRALVVVALHVDFKRYVFFALNSYPTWFDASGDVHVSHLPLGELAPAVSRSGIDFVTECALKAQGDL